MSNKQRKITPEDVQELQSGQVFVFGSNEAGKHEAGAAKLAKEKFGARDGQGYGPMGDCFAIPTKSWTVDQLSLDTIECYVVRFCEYAALNKDKEFLVTQIGCGLAGYSPGEIAPFFALAEMADNIHLPQSFWDIIDKTYLEDLVKFMSIENDGAENELSNV